MKSARANSHQAYHHGDLRRALVVAALAALDESGVDAVTIREVARRAGVAHSAPANHFRDRAALLTAVAVQIFGDIQQAVENALAKGPAGRDERLSVFADAVVQFALGHPNRYRLLWRKDCLDATDVNLDAAGTVIYETVKQVLGPVATTHTISADTQVIAAWSMIHGYVSLRLDGTLIDGSDEANGKPRAAAIVDVLIKGL